jgi:hypothetical protein
MNKIYNINFNCFLNFKIELNNWLLIYPKLDEDRALIYVNMLRQVGQQQGMIINEPIHIQMEDDETETFANTLRTNLNEQVNYFP